MADGTTRSEITPARHIQPSEMAHQFDKLLQALEAFNYQMKNHAQGCYLLAPTTGSTQITGAGNTTWRVNRTIGMVVVNGTGDSLSAGADVVVHSGSKLVNSGQSCKAAHIAYLSSGAITLMFVKGSAATTGSEALPTRAAIQSAVDAASGSSDTKWIMIGSATVNRTADTTLTQSYQNEDRSMAGVNRDTGILDWSTWAD